MRSARAVGNTPAAERLRGQLRALAGTVVYHFAKGHGSSATITTAAVGEEPPASRAAADDWRGKKTK